MDGFGVITYTPEEDFTGTDSFTYRADDGETESDPATYGDRHEQRAGVFADEEITLAHGQARGRSRSSAATARATT